jgi:hypothetical protein
MPKSRCFDRETIENVRDALANASDPPSKLSTREAVEELADLIRAKRAAGWRRQDIVNFLTQHGLDIPEATLRTYASARHASEPADADSRTGGPQGIDAGIERGPGASDTRPAPSRRATRRPDDRVAHIEQYDV